MSSRDPQREKWLRSIGKVFKTNPRNGNEESTVWLRRRKLEERFNDVLGFSGVHICLDGPTGTGKSSLAITGLNRAEIKYVLVQLTEKMNWADFCKRLVTLPVIHESSVSAGLDVGVEGLVPKGSFQVSLGASKRATDSVDLLEKIAGSWAEHDICNMMVKKETALLIDDFERANPEIVVRIADMCKLLTESYVHPAAKLIVVGTGDIYKNLYLANSSLEARLEEISVGTISDANESWTFLRMGFEKLGLRHPGNSRFVSKEERLECIRAVYDAADGLPKTLNELGRDISIKGFNRSGVTPTDVKEVARQMPEKGLSRFQREFSKMTKLIEKSTAARIVLYKMYKSGIGQIHYRSDLIKSLKYELPEEQVDSAIQELITSEFLIQTGPHEEVLYVTDPKFAHNLGVVIEDPEKYGQSPDKYALIGQLTLPFFVRDET